MSATAEKPKAEPKKPTTPADLVANLKARRDLVTVRYLAVLEQTGVSPNSTKFLDEIQAIDRHLAFLSTEYGPGGTPTGGKK